jgi:FAD/FMN-containing dehydrogenase
MLSIKALKKIVGAEHVLTDVESRTRAATNWSVENFKARQQGRLILPEVVVRPGTEEEVIRLQDWAQDNHVALSVIGGSSGWDDGEVPPLMLDVSRFDAIGEWDEESLLLQVGAGMTIAALEAHVNTLGYTTGQQLRSRNIATVGGAIATEARGLFSGKYGSFADSVYGVQISESLTEESSSVILGATLVVHPLPAVRAWGVFAFASWDDALDATRLVTRGDCHPACIRLFDAAAALSYFDTERPVVLLGFEGEEITQTGQYQQGAAICQKLGGLLLPPEKGDAWYEEERYATFWSVNASPDKCAARQEFFYLWSEMKETCETIIETLAPLTESLKIEICHANAQGATLEVYYTALYSNYPEIISEIELMG